MADNIPNEEDLVKAANEWLRKSDLENLTTKNLITQVYNFILFFYYVLTHCFFNIIRWRTYLNVI
jgi:hypothetical protein